MKAPPDVNRSNSQRRGLHGQQLKLKPQLLGMKIPCGLDSQVPQKDAIRPGSQKYLFGEVFRDLARAKESEVLEGHLMPDHVHMLISIPPKDAVAQVVIGYIKGKSAIQEDC